MEIRERVQCLYDKDIKAAYANLQELEALSEKESALYPFVDEFITMLKSGEYVIRVRGFRLLCKQARWDEQGKINDHIAEILAAVEDEKPTAVRQALQALRDVVPYKKELADRIAGMARLIDLSQFKDTMRPLIAKDIQGLLSLIAEQSPNI